VGEGQPLELNVLDPSVAGRVCIEDDQPVKPGATTAADSAFSPGLGM